MIRYIPNVYEVGRKVGETVPRPLMQLAIILLLAFALFVAVKKEK